MRLEDILSETNIRNAIKRVRSNKGAAGVDGLGVEDFQRWFDNNWFAIKARILEGTYCPSPVRKVEIPKAGAGKRMLGIPTVLDRVIQQSLKYELEQIWEPKFSETSYGYRPGRRATDAVKKAQTLTNEKKRWVVELDLEKFFDNANHDKLMSDLAKQIEDKRILKLIRKYLQSGIMEGGIVSLRRQGIPQGSPLSPLLSNIILDKLDKELERRNHSFVRYADDSSIYVGSRKAGQRVLKSITRFIETKLQLKVNRTKSQVTHASKSQILGFSFYWSHKEYRIRIAPKRVRQFKRTLRNQTRRWSGSSVEDRLKYLSKIVIGWTNYFKIADCKKLLTKLDEWVRRRIRAFIWVTWKKIRTKQRNLQRLGVKKGKAWEWANTRKGHWRIAGSFILSTTLTNAVLEKMGYTSLLSVYLR